MEKPSNSSPNWMTMAERRQLRSLDHPELLCKEPPSGLNLTMNAIKSERSRLGAERIASRALLLGSLCGGGQTVKDKSFLSILWSI
jgi:hypothetical protein